MMSVIGKRRIRKTNIDFEINKKLNEAGYPDTRTLFLKTRTTAVLIQEGVQVHARFDARVESA
ncbi:MAG: hypothetical protein WKF71_19080 [Pyrinomonadaceae bacterium]